MFFFLFLFCPVFSTGCSSNNDWWHWKKKKCVCACVRACVCVCVCVHVYLRTCECTSTHPSLNCICESACICLCICRVSLFKKPPPTNLSCILLFSCCVWFGSVNVCCGLLYTYTAIQWVQFTCVLPKPPLLPCVYVHYTSVCVIVCDCVRARSYVVHNW